MGHNQGRWAYQVEENLRASSGKLIDVMDSNFTPVYTEFGQKAGKIACEYVKEHADVFTFLQNNSLLNVSTFGTGVLHPYYDPPNTEEFPILKYFRNVNTLLSLEDQGVLERHKKSIAEVKNLFGTCLHVARGLVKQYTCAEYMVIAAKEIKPFCELDPNFVPKKRDYVPRDELNLETLKCFTELALKCSMEGVPTNGY